MNHNDPGFTAEEKSAIQYYLQDPHPPWWQQSHDLGYLVPTATMIAWGIVAEIQPLALVGLAVLLLFKLKNTIEGLRWNLVFRSIFQKYDAALQGDSGLSNNESEYAS